MKTSIWTKEHDLPELRHGMILKVRSKQFGIVYYSLYTQGNGQKPYPYLQHISPNSSGWDLLETHEILTVWQNMTDFLKEMGSDTSKW